MPGHIESDKQVAGLLTRTEYALIGKVLVDTQ